jgi:hypothetical protein
MDARHLSNITNYFEKHLGWNFHFQPKIDEGLE